MNKTVIHNTAIAILVLPVLILSIFKPVIWVLSMLSAIFYSQWRRTAFKTCPRNVLIGYKLEVVGGKNISIGNRTRIKTEVILSAHIKYAGDKFNPVITIGDNVLIQRHSHITSINRISIGNGVVIGSDTFITDNAHGGGADILDQLSQRPMLRPLYSKGPVVIGDRVWIGDKVIILPGVTIGEGAIIGAGAVVTKDVPAFCVAVGNPARIVKQMK